MKKAKKIAVLLLCAILLVGATIAGTMAYLTSSASVENTFTVGNVAITMDETLVDPYGNPAQLINGVTIVPIKDGETASRTDANEYKLIPGHTYTKNPTIKVSEGSENCYLFVKIENGLGAAGDLAIDTTKWALVEGTEATTSVWVYGNKVGENDISMIVTGAGDTATPFETFTFGKDADPNQFMIKDNEGNVAGSQKIVVTAYAIQATDLGAENATAAQIWTNLLKNK